MTTPQGRAAMETTILRFTVALCAARDDEDLVKRVIDAECEEWPVGLQAAMLKVTLRVIVAQYLASLARRSERLTGLDVDAALRAQAADNEGVTNP